MSSLEEALKNLKFDNGLGKQVSFPLVGFKEMEEDRVERYSSAGCFASIGGRPSTVIGAKYETEDFGVVEHVIAWDGSSAKPVMTECGISYEELSPTQLVEYQYEEDGPWALAKMSLEPLEFYKGSKFKAWREMLDNPSCEAAFARMIQAGPLNCIYDKLGFPIPEKEQAMWTIKDEKSGKLVDIPRPVFGLRIWDPNSDSYKPVSALMGGAPATAEDLAAYWEETLKELKVKHGDEYINKLISR